MISQLSSFYSILPDFTSFKFKIKIFRKIILTDIFKLQYNNTLHLLLFSPTLKVPFRWNNKARSDIFMLDSSLLFLINTGKLV